MELNVINPKAKFILHVIEVQPTLTEEICIADAIDLQLELIREEILVGKPQGL